MIYWKTFAKGLNALNHNDLMFQALANIGLETGTRRIALISSSQQTLASFLAEATTLGIR